MILFRIEENFQKVFKLKIHFKKLEEELSFYYLKGNNKVTVYLKKQNKIKAWFFQKNNTIELC